MARCGACSGGARLQNTETHPVVIGDVNELTLRVWVVGHGGPEHHPLLRVGSLLYVNGDGAQPLLDTGVLALA